MEMQMSNEPQSATKRLTIDDPVGKETLDKLAELETGEINTSLQLMALKQEEVRLLAVGRKIDDERHRIFERLLMERGLAPNNQATIDSATGKITLVRPAPGTPAQGIPPEVMAAVEKARADRETQTTVPTNGQS
jgi:hypothetical protein